MIFKFDDLYLAHKHHTLISYMIPKAFFFIRHKEKCNTSHRFYIPVQAILVKTVDSGQRYQKHHRVFESHRRKRLWSGVSVPQSEVSALPVSEFKPQNNNKTVYILKIFKSYFLMTKS